MDPELPQTAESAIRKIKEIDAGLEALYKEVWIPPSLVAPLINSSLPEHWELEPPEVLELPVEYMAKVQQLPGFDETCQLQNLAELRALHQTRENLHLAIGDPHSYSKYLRARRQEIDDLIVEFCLSGKANISLAEHRAHLLIAEDITARLHRLVLF